MELNNIQKTKRLELERKDKLKFYGILSLRKGELEAEIAKKSFVLSISITYTDAEAIMASRTAIKHIGVNPDDYLIPALLMKVDVDEIIRVPEGKVIEPLPQPAVLKVQKSNQDMISYIRLVFDQVGTETEKKVAEKVIKKFEEKNEKR